jgi:hypothetical protein
VQGGDAIWGLLNLELWYRTFIDGNGIQTLNQNRNQNRNRNRNQNQNPEPRTLNPALNPEPRTLEPTALTRS